MGYHVILNHDKKGLKAFYVERKDELVNYPITEDTIIYQGEKDWAPVVVSQDEKYKDYLDPAFRAGKKAEFLFEKLCKQKGMIIEKLSQFQDSFTQYTHNAKAKVKRSDYLVRKPFMCEVEVKCFSCYGTNAAPFYLLKWSDIKGHQNMESLVNTDVIIAIFQRNGEDPIENSLRMIRLKDIFSLNYKSISYDDKNKASRIPLEIMTPGFGLLIAEKTV